MAQEEKEINDLNGAVLISEDWTAVLVGGAVILITLLGVRIADPIYEWAGIEGILRNVTSAQNWRNVLGQFVLLVFSAAAILIGKNTLIIWVFFGFTSSP